ncbi:MAG: PQQ-binding-like beta-propeller repeat protein, partial [Verrucomicrobiales bacterium]|nr:PQQ-binding-like beta-propeller repeat protein [Verrucomicrobiales bacterium]
KQPGPEIEVDLEILAAKAESSLGNREQAGQRLDFLLEKLASDYWRRREVMSLRINLLASDAEREAMLAKAKAAYEANPKNESAVLDYAELLAASELRRDAVKVLRLAAAELPESERLEKKTLELLERAGDDGELEDYLAARLNQFPGRDDLRFRLAKVQFLLAKPKKADANFRQVLQRMPEENRGARLLELARFLRQSNLVSLAVPLFNEFLQDHPDRLDVRRELAETHLALRERNASRGVVAGMDVTGAEIENFLDVVQFMIREEFYPEAKAALEKRLQSDPENFELRLMLASVMGKTGDRKTAMSLLETTRALADTNARYTRWLEAGMEVHELFDNVGLFFDSEQARFNAVGEENWTAQQLENFVTLCTVGERKKLTGRVAQAIRTRLEVESIAPDVRLQLRLLLVKALESIPGRAPEIEEQLKLLAEEDETRGDEYALRRALLYHSLSRPDLAAQALSGVTVENVSDTSVLRAAVPVFIEFGLAKSAEAALRHVTETEPAELQNWEKRLSLLAALGEEGELRKVIRDLLAGVDRVDLSTESVETLRWHLLDSHWRSVAALLARNTPESLAEVLPLLESVHRESSDRDRLWSLWARAYVLNSLGRVPERDAAIEELTATAFRSRDETEPNGAGETKIVFPDGLAISLSAAMDLLTGNTTEPGSDPAETSGPIANLQAAWAFEVDPGASVLQIEPIGTGWLLVLDDRGTMYCVDTVSGKLRWRERYGLPSLNGNGAGMSGANRSNAGSGTTMSGGSGIQIANQFYRVHQSGSSMTVQQLFAPYQTATLGASGGSISGAAAGNSTGWDATPVKLVRQFTTDHESTFYLTFGTEIRAFSAETGRFLWLADMGDENGREAGQSRISSTAVPGVTLKRDGNRLIAFSPATGTAAGVSADTGKLLWRRQLKADPGTDGTVFSLNSGLSLDSGRAFLIGAESAILDAASGETIWEFDSNAVRTFPVGLRHVPVERSDREGNPDAEADRQAVERALASVAAPVRPGFLNHLAESGTRHNSVKQFTANRGALVAPAVNWSASRLQNDTPAFADLSGDRMLLMDEFGVREISLRFPLKSRRFPVTGTYLGTAGDSAWFLNRDSITRLDFGVLDSGDQSIFTIALAGLAQDGRSGATLSGSRVYVTGPGGIAIFNAHSGKLIHESVWPEGFAEYRGKHGGVNRGSGLRYVVQGVIVPRAGLSANCVPLRDRTAGETLYSVIGKSSVVALRSPRPVPNPAD